MSLKVLTVGCGNMGRSHALGYHNIDGFELVGLVDLVEENRRRVNEELGGNYAEFNTLEEALEATKPDAVAICTYPDTHYPLAKMALEAGCHIFVEKPLADTIEKAEDLIGIAREKKLKMMIGYILRVHPSWVKFIEMSHELGKPLVMRMNLNQQSSGAMWNTHKNLMSSISPIVDCGVHYVDVMCQMTRSKPVRVSGIGALLTDELPENRINYGQLQVTFEDGSVGWYEAGWGPMMSEMAFFVKDVVGPKGCVTIEAKTAGGKGASANVDSHTKTESLRRHYSDLDDKGNLAKEDEWVDMTDEPTHDELCQREQEAFLQAIQEDADLESVWADAINSMSIVAAADESFRTGRTVEL